VKPNKCNIRKILRILATKGTIEIFLYINNNANIGYNSVLEYAICSEIVKSRASVNITMARLTDLGLLERTITQERPIRTGYKVSKKGCLVIQHLHKLEQITKYSVG